MLVYLTKDFILVFIVKTISMVAMSLSLGSLGNGCKSSIGLFSFISLDKVFSSIFGLSFLFSDKSDKCEHDSMTETCAFVFESSLTVRLQPCYHLPGGL